MLEAYAELAAKLERLAEPGMRAGQVREALRSVEPDDAAALLAQARNAAARTGLPKAQTTWLAIAHALLDRAFVEELSSVAEAASQAELIGVANLLREHGIDDDREVKLRVPDIAGGRPLTLGERKALARKADPALIKRVVRDPSPDVIGIALGNPILTEPDVVRVAAARPVHPEVLRIVARHVKWSARYAVRNAIIRNPFGEPQVAALFVPLLRPKDLREVSRSMELSAVVRLACRPILELRPPSQAPGG